MCLRAVIVSSLCGVRVLEPAASLTAPRMLKSSIFSLMHRVRSASASLTFVFSGTVVSGTCWLPSFVLVYSIVHYPSQHLPPGITSRRSEEDAVGDEEKYFPQLDIVWIVAECNQMLVFQRCKLIVRASWDAPENATAISSYRVQKPHEFIRMGISRCSGVLTFCHDDRRFLCDVANVLSRRSTVPIQCRERSLVTFPITNNTNSN